MNRKRTFSSAVTSTTDCVSDARKKVGWEGKLHESLEKRTVVCDAGSLLRLEKQLNVFFFSKFCER